MQRARWIALVLAIALVAGLQAVPFLGDGGGRRPGTPGSGPIVMAAPGLRDIARHWARSLIETAVQRGYVHGYPDGTFRPDAPVTRAEALKLVVAAWGLKPDPKGTQPFADLGGHWLAAQGWVQAALQAGIILPEEASGRFEPDPPAAREQLAVWVVRAMKGEDRARAWQGTLPFRDAGDVTRVGHVALAAERGIVTGYPDGTFRPKGTATRAEAVAMVERALRQPPFDYPPSPPPPGQGTVPDPSSPDWSGQVMPRRAFKVGDSLSLTITVFRGPEPNRATAGGTFLADVRVTRADAAGATLQASVYLGGGVTRLSEARYDYATGNWEVTRSALDAAKAGFGDRDLWAMVFFPGVTDLSALSGLGTSVTVDGVLPGEASRARVTLTHSGYGTVNDRPAVGVEASAPDLGVTGIVRIDPSVPWTLAGTLERQQPGRWERWHWFHATRGGGQ